MVQRFIARAAMSFLFSIVLPLVYVVYRSLADMSRGKRARKEKKEHM
jgi:hypothetical protein